MKKQAKASSSKTKPPLIPAEVSGEPEMPVTPEEAVLDVHPPAFPISGIGASAEGLATFETFFSGIPADKDSGRAFILVQHLAPNHKGILTDLIRRYTRKQTPGYRPSIRRMVRKPGRQSVLRREMERMLWLSGN
jgi:two-component system CheB/CheR fusion protein